MTYHIAYDHQCEACGADFIPYEEHLPCPKCGAAAKTWLDYARQAAASLNVNRGDTGTFMPRGGQCRGLGEVPPLRHEIRHLFIVFVERETPHQLRDRAQVGAEARLIFRIHQSSHMNPRLPAESPPSALKPKRLAENPSRVRGN